MRLAPLLLALLVLPLAASSAGARSAATLSFARITPVGSGLDQPTYLTATAAEPTKLYVTEKTGKVRVLVNGALQPDAFLDLSAEVSTDSEQGLASLAFDRGYATNHYLYVCYSGLNGDIHVDRFTSADGSVSLATRKQLLLVAHPVNPNHYGCLVTAAPDRKLYLGTGDGGGAGDQDNHAQDTSTKLGKFLSLDLTKSTATWRMIGLGLRNPWRYSFDRENGDLYIGDVGQNLWEELDVVRAGDSLLNFGWPLWEGKAAYRPDAAQAPFAKLVTPVYVYKHEGGLCSITGGYVYRGSAVPAAKGLYVSGDFCTGRLTTMKVIDGKATSITNLAQKLPGLSSFGEDANGELYALAIGNQFVPAGVFKLRQ